MSWQRPPEVDVERQWREAITHAVIEIVAKMESCGYHRPRIETAWRRLALHKEWVEDTGGES